MPNACFIDTNILLYAKDPGEPSKQRKALAWLDALADEQRAVISPQVLNEFAHNVLRKFPHISHERLTEYLESMRPWCLAPTSDGTALGGLTIHRRYKLSFYDSVLVASALAYGCDMFLTEDMSHQQRIGDMRLVNPFAGEPSAYL
jgi:predicted nucleic acid-binding protein